jgi:hypothetical protein
MAYDVLPTEVEQGVHARLGAYSPVLTNNDQGLRGLGAGIGPTNISIGPDGQWGISTGTQPTPTSILDNITQWLGESTVFAGVPNSLLAIGGLLVLFAGGGRRRRRYY